MMPKFNDIDLSKWKEYDDINVESLWFFDKRDNSGKHDGFYHGNFIPQIPRQLIKRFTKENDIVLDPFMGSGTTAYECESLTRKFIGIDIRREMVDYVKERLNYGLCLEGDSSDISTFDKINNFLITKQRESVNFVILHPPYYDIVKFSNNPKDLSNSSSVDVFLNNFSKVITNCIKVLEDNRHIAIVIGDKYEKGELTPLGFLCLKVAQEKGLQLKSIIVKNMENNRAKKNMNSIWRYRALSSDYSIFRHEYIIILKKGKK